MSGSGDLVELAALRDVDDLNLEAQGQAYPDAKRFFDYRSMLDETELDAVLVSSPDHTHAVAAIAAMKKGVRCFCEKLLAHGDAKIRAMRKIAKEKKLATPMGAVIHATENYRRVVELIQAGAIGETTEAHVWRAKGRGGYPEPSRENLIFLKTSIESNGLDPFNGLTTILVICPRGGAGTGLSTRKRSAIWVVA